MIDADAWARRPDVAARLSVRVDVGFFALVPGAGTGGTPRGEAFETGWIVADLVRLHANLVLAVRHPQNRGVAAEVARSWIDNLEIFFARIGLAPPPGGWRGA